MNREAGISNQIKLIMEKEICGGLVTIVACGHALECFKLDQENIKGPLSYKYIMTSVDVYESIHHKIITC